EWLDHAWTDPEARVLVVAGNRVRPVDGVIPWVAPDEAAVEGTRVLLGEGEGWTGLRGLLPYLAGEGVEQAPLVFHAIGLAEWLFATRHCPRCGARLEPR